MFGLPKKNKYKIQNNSRTVAIKQRDYIKEYLYIVALAILFCLIVSIISYDPTDPSTFHRLSNEQQKISNYFGPFGASLADWAFQIFGIGAIVFLILFLVQLLHTFRRPLSKNRVYLKLFGYPQLILFYLGFVSGIKPLTNFKGIQILTGGVIGNKVFELFDGFFDTSGALIILFLGALSSLTLCLGITPLSSVLWFLRLAPSKHTKNFAQNVSVDIPPISNDLFDTQTPASFSSVSNRIDQHVFLDLISVLESKVPGSFYDILQSKEFQDIHHLFPIACGKTQENHKIVLDIGKMPNLLLESIASGKKTQIVNILILSLMLNKTPSDLKLILVDPQMLEFAHYEGIEHLLMPVITSSPKCVSMFEWLVEETEKRYLCLKQFKVRNFAAFKNQVALPEIVVVVSELYDLMMTVPYELEAHLQKLSSKAHLVGIHMVFVTQKSSQEVLTTSIYNHFSSKLDIYENKMTIFSAGRAETFPMDFVNISLNEIKVLTNKLRTLYPFLSENITLK